jgi:hypothetical protein
MLLTHGLVVRIALAVPFSLPLGHRSGRQSQTQYHCP